MAYQQEYKLADYFSVIGLDEELKTLDQTQEGGEQPPTKPESLQSVESKPPPLPLYLCPLATLSQFCSTYHRLRNTMPIDNMIEKVEIIVMKDSFMKLQYNTQVEKWIDLDGSNQIFLRIIYGHHRPITDINFYRIKYQKGQPDKMSIPDSMGIEPVPIKMYGDPDADKKFKKTKKANPKGDKKKDMLCFYGDFDLTPYLESVQSSQQGTNLCFCYSRKKKNMPIQDIEVIQGVPGLKGQEDIEFNLPPQMKQVNYRLGKVVKNRLLCFKYRDFLKKKFEAKVLDRYPFEGRDRSYYEFPDSLSQFCFPSGIQFTTERSTPSYFSFILTDAEGQHIYGTALIFDEILSNELKNKLKQNYVQNVENIYSQKAVCVLSHYAFMDSFKEILKQLYRIHLSNTPIPIERYIVNIMDEIPVPDKGNILVLHEIGNQIIPFFRHIDQYPPYASKQDIEYLFRALSAEQVIEIFLALLLEKKVLLISQHKSLLTHAVVALISFLFPLSWKHVLIPILPKNMTDVLDAPVPFLIGIDPFIIKDDCFEIPNEVYRVDLDNGSISFRDSKPKLPSKEFKILKQRLIKATEGIERPDPLLDQVDQAFNVIQVDPEEENVFQFNEFEIRDAFLEFMTGIMSGYTKCLNAPEQSKDVFFDSRDFFDFKKFRQAKDATKNITLIYKLTETTLFANFIEARSFGKSDQDDQIMYFDEICKQKRSKKQPQLVRLYKEKKTVKTMAPCEEGLEPNQTFKYQTFPKFDLSLFYVPRKIENYNEETGSLLKSLINNEQLQKMHDTEWARYLSEIIYLLWFQIFCTTLPMYQNYAKDLIFFSKKLLDHVNKKLAPMRDIEMIYRRLFEACGTCRLQEEILELFNDMKKNKIDPDKVTFGTYYQAFLISKKHNSGNVATGGTGAFSFPVLHKKESYLKYTPEDFQKKLQEFARCEEEEKVNRPSRFSNGSVNVKSDSENGGDFIETQVESIRTSQVRLSQILENSLYMNIELSCQQCEKPLKEEEIMSGFSKNLSSYVIKCPMCKENFVPRFMVYSEYKTDYLKGREGMSIQLLSPVTLYKEYINIVEQKGEQIVLRENFLKDHRTVFWNIILYFKIMRLPIFMMDLDYSQLHIKVHVSQIKKFLPLEKKNSTIISLGQIQKQGSSNKLDQDKLRRLEQSPGRKSSLSRITSSVVDAILGSNQKNMGDNQSERGSVNNENQDQTPQQKHGESKSLSNYFVKKHGSHKSGSGAGSVVTSMSDLERIEKIMTQAQYASKSIVKYFSKHLEEFRREMQYAKEIILSDLMSQGIPEAMNKYANVNMNPNPLTKNFSEWTKNTQQVTAEAIINESATTSRQGSFQGTRMIGSTNNFDNQLLLQKPSSSQNLKNPHSSLICSINQGSSNSNSSTSPSMLHNVKLHQPNSDLHLGSLRISETSITKHGVSQQVNLHHQLGLGGIVPGSYQSASAGSSLSSSMKPPRDMKDAQLKMQQRQQQQQQLQNINL